MPKPMSLTIEIEEIAFGRVWRTLDAMPGVINIHMKGQGPKQLKPATEVLNKKTTARLVLEALLIKSPASKLLLEEAILAGGKQKASLADTLTKLKKQKNISPAGKGMFKITAAGIKAATATEQEKQNGSN